jgi:hypothetical protein
MVPAALLANQAAVTKTTPRPFKLGSGKTQLGAQLGGGLVE